MYIYQLSLILPLVRRFIACYEVICCPSRRFWRTECPSPGCKTHLSSRVVVEMPVSSAWCVDVLQISFDPGEEQRGRGGGWLSASVLLVHKAFWKLHFNPFCSPVAVSERVESGLGEFSPPPHRRSDRWLRTFFPDELCLQILRWRLTLETVAWR